MGEKGNGLRPLRPLYQNIWIHCTLLARTDQWSLLNLLAQAGIDTVAVKAALATGKLKEEEVVTRIPVIW